MAPSGVSSETKTESSTGSTSYRNRSHPVLAITMGDRNGIGPEIILKSLSELQKSDPGRKCGVLLFASRDTMRFYSRVSGDSVDRSPLYHDSEQNVSLSSDFLFPPSREDLPVPEPGNVILIPCREPQEEVSPGAITAESGKLAMDAVAAGAGACLSGHADALVTAPISKEAIHRAGFRVPGHTEYLAQLTGANSVGMMLVNRYMRIGLATIHVPLRDVAGLLSAELILARLGLYHQTLKHDFGIAQPRISVLGLNPHAGDGGVLGSEEQEIIMPAMESAKKENIHVDGPWPADGYFGNKEYERADLVLAMYHDQGLIPLKLAGFGGGVNVTAGLPIIRTSPDHGTAFSLAGKNQAEAGSMLAAWNLALELIERRASSRIVSRSSHAN